MRHMLRQLVEEEPGLAFLGEAGSAELALDTLQSERPDLVLVDLSLPGMTGLELVRRLRQEYPVLRCLVVSGHVEELYVQAALNAGAGGYVAKDYPEALVEAIHQVLSGEVVVVRGD